MVTWICTGWPWPWSETPATCCSRPCTGPWRRGSRCPDVGTQTVRPASPPKTVIKKKKKQSRWRPYRLGGVVVEEADVDVVRERLRPAVLGAVPAHLAQLCGTKGFKSVGKYTRDENLGQCSSPSSGLMTSWKSSGQLTTTTSPTLAACQQVRLSHIHGHTEKETTHGSDYTITHHP